MNFNINRILVYFIFQNAFCSVLAAEEKLNAKCFYNQKNVLGAKVTEHSVSKNDTSWGLTLSVLYTFDILNGKHVCQIDTQNYTRF